MTSFSSLVYLRKILELDMSIKLEVVYENIEISIGTNSIVANLFYC